MVVNVPSFILSISMYKSFSKTAFETFWFAYSKTYKALKLLLEELYVKDNNSSGNRPQAYSLCFLHD